MPPQTTRTRSANITTRLKIAVSSIHGGGETVFCNPPYGRNIGDWIRKASQEASKPDTLVVLLVPARTDTRWFQNYILHRAEVRFLPGRLKYEVDGQAGEAAPFPSMVVIMRTGER